jgi:hypothetical protein
MKTLALLGTTLGLGVTSGLGLYATVLAVGLSTRLGWVVLPEHLSALRVLGDTTVLVVAGLLYAVEFLADKVPAVEHVWDLVHTAVRPVGAAILAVRVATGTDMGGPEEIALVLLGGGAALVAHSAKAGTRVAAAAAGGHAFGAGVVLSVAEDVVAFLLAPLAVAHPIAALAVAGALFGLFLLLAPAGFRFLRSRLVVLRYGLEHSVLDRGRATLGEAHLPERVLRALVAAGAAPGRDLVVAGWVTGFPGLPRWGAGYLAFGAKGPVFARPGLFRVRVLPLPGGTAPPVLVERLTGREVRVERGGKRTVVALAPLSPPMLERLRAALNAR